MKDLIRRLLISLDQFINVCVWVDGEGFGSPDETLSARAYRLRSKSNVWQWIDALFGVGHCQRSYENEMNKKQLPIEYQVKEPQ